MFSYIIFASYHHDHQLHYQQQQGDGEGLKLHNKLQCYSKLFVVLSRLAAIG